MTAVAFLGLGTMGYPMAGHLQREGYDVCVYNRSSAKALRWVEEYAGRRADTPREACAGAELVFCCVGNDDDLRAVALGEQGAFAGMAPGSLFVDHTTASAEVARELSLLAAERELGFLDAPVSGGQAGAVNGALTVMVGGEEAFYRRAEPLLRSYARMVRRMGDVGSGQLTKMVNQICVAGLLQGLAEALHFARCAGLDGEAAMQVIGKGAAQSWPPEHAGRRVRLRLRRGLDAQGPVDPARRGAAQRRAVAGHGAGRPVLRRSAGDGRRSLGYLQPDRPAAFVTRLRRGR